MPYKTRRSLLIALASALLLPWSLSAQAFMFEAKSKTAFLLEIYKPTFTDSYSTGSRNSINYSLRTLALFLSLRRQIKEQTFFVVELPFAHALFDTIRKVDADFFLESSSSNQAGNLYLGIEKAKPASRFSTEVGIRLPFVKESVSRSAEIGRASDYDRREAFQNFATLRAAIHYRSKRAEGWKFHGRGGLALHRDLERMRDHYLTIPLNFEVRYEKPRFAVGVLLPIRVEMSHKTTSLNYRSPSRSFKLKQIQKWSFITSLKFGRVRVVAALPFQDSEQPFPPEFELNLNVQISNK